MFRVLSGLLVLAACNCALAISFDDKVKWNGYVKVEGATNMHGGIKTGTSFLGGIRVDATYEEVLCVGIIGATHTREIQPNVGSVQKVTSLDVQREIRLGNLSYLYYFASNLSGRFGVMDAEDFFDITESATDLRNSAFVNAIAWDKVTQIASFPFPGFGALMQYNHADKYILLGLYQGNPKYQNTVFSRGFMLISEFGNTLDLHYKFTYNLSLKLGLWIYQANNVPNYTNARGAYFIAQNTWQFQYHPMESFMQIAFSDESPKKYPFSFTIGARAYDIAYTNKVDSLSFGIGKVSIHDLPSEVVFELAYVYRFYKHFLLNPDLQYFVKPSGIYPNATVFQLRLTYVFN